MAHDEEQDTRIYTAVVNDEEQYSIWLADKEIPAGWRAVGKTGQKAECLAYIAEVWTDMRPLSLRKWMESQQRSQAPGEGGERGGAGPSS
jgi:MbtH protein